MPTKHVTHVCAMSAADYWSLRDTSGFDTYVQSMEGNDFQVVSQSENVETGEVTRSAKVTARKNPVPRAFRGALGCVQEFSFTVTEAWFPGVFDEAHAMRLTSVPAVMAEKQVICAREWVVPRDASSCELHFEMTVSVSLPGIGGLVARGILEGSCKGFGDRPKRALEYVAHEDASGAGSSGAPTAPSLPLRWPRVLSGCAHATVLLWSLLAAAELVSPRVDVLLVHGGLCAVLLAAQLAAATAERKAVTAVAVEPSAVVAVPAPMLPMEPPSPPVQPIAKALAGLCRSIAACACVDKT